MILAQVISEACLRDQWFHVERTVHSPQNGLLWLIQIIVISCDISTRMNSIQILVILEIHRFPGHLYLQLFYRICNFKVLKVQARPHRFSKTLSEGQNYFPNFKTLFFSFTMLTQKKWWVKLLAPFTNEGRGTCLHKWFSLPFTHG